MKLPDCHTPRQRPGTVLVGSRNGSSAELNLAALTLPVARLRPQISIRRVRRLDSSWLGRIGLRFT